MGEAVQTAAAGRRVTYERRRPEDTVLYQLVQEHLETFLAQVELEIGTGLPEFVEEEFDAFLDCGILARGFLRLRCADCAHEKLVAFSCKRRGFCPSCGARRMAETAAHLVDHVIPRVPVRQWVLSFPIPLRLLFATHPELLAPVLQIVHRVIATFLIQQAGTPTHRSPHRRRHPDTAFRHQPPISTSICIASSSMASTAPPRAPRPSTPCPPRPRSSSKPYSTRHHEAPHEPDAQGRAALRRYRMRFLTRKGFLIEEQGMSYLADTDPDRALGSLQAAACTYRIALGPRAGHKVLSLQTVPTREPPAPVRCVNEQGFSLHAEVCCAAHERHKLEHLCRYITRPAIANERLTLNRAGDVVLQLKSPYHDGTTHVVMSPLELMQRLAALVPRPRLHLIRFHGVLAPNAKLRSAIIPSAPVNAPNAAAVHADAPPSLGAGAPELCPVAQAGIRYRHRAVSAVRRYLDDHRRHRTSLRDRQDPHPSRLVRPGTAPIARAVIRPTPNGLDPGRDLLGSPEPTAPFALHSPERPKRLGSGRLGPMNRPKNPRSWTDGSRT